MTQIGIVYSGVSYQQLSIESEVCLRDLRIVPIYDLLKLDLRTFDALIFPRGTDQEFMYLIRHKILHFLNRDGIVVAIGEISTNWLPSCNWQRPIVEDNEPLSIVREHPIVKGLEPDDLQWHKALTEMCSHGHFSAPPGSEVIVTNQKGDAIIYVDRKSTKGTIVGISNLDAFCHAFHGIEASRIFLDNLIEWVTEEASQIRQTREAYECRLGVFYSGAKVHYDTFTSSPIGHSLELINAFMLAQVDISEYDVLLIPRESNQEALMKEKNRILQFLNQGKTLVSFGEITRPWLPSCQWENRAVDVQTLRILNPVHPLMEGLMREDIQWHSHGVFHPYPKAEVVVEEASGGAIIYIDDKSHPGTILATTLDPEVHAGYGTKKTLKFLRKVIDWAVQNHLAKLHEVSERDS